MIIGTAGHIDHGKTALVRALTGIDTDRLPEEKRRGITIDLGFAPLALPNVGVAGVVDVPGHEAFVRTMLAGATGIDVALLVVAADEGVMPQTREHVAILELLGVRGGVVALTKCDLVEPDWLDLVRLDVTEVLASTALRAAPVIPTSVVSGSGLDTLRDALARCGSAAATRPANDLFRMPIDRVFTMRGTGTVVTGTVWSGQIARDAVVRVAPSDRTVRVRGLQAHGAAVDEAAPGTRLAVALAGIDHHDLRRGDELVTDAGWRRTRVLRADVRLLEGSVAALSPRARVRFHLGTNEVGARVVTPGGPIAAGETKAARIVLDAPVVARAGDRFVLRGGSPLVTLGGGVVMDPAPPHRRARPWTGPRAQPWERLALILAEAGAAGTEWDDLPVRLGVAPSELNAVAARCGPPLRLGKRLFERALLPALTTTLVQRVREYHLERPLEPGPALQTVRGRLTGHPDLIDEAVRRAESEAVVEVQGGTVRVAGWAPQLTERDRDIRNELTASLLSAGAEPPSVDELGTALGPQVVPILRMLEREGVVTPVEAGRYYATEVLSDLVQRLRAGMRPHQVYSPAELREVIGLSRKYLIPFLEYCDRTGVTERRSAGRVLHGT